MDRPKRAAVSARAWPIRGQRLVLQLGRVFDAQAFRGNGEGELMGGQVAKGHVRLWVVVC